MVEGRLQVWVGKRGGANRVLTFGASRTSQLCTRIHIEELFYEVHLEPTDDDRFIFTEELFSDRSHGRSHRHGLAPGRQEAQIHSNLELNTPCPVGKIIHGALSNWRVYHFHDTGETARAKLTGSLHDHRFLRPDGSNLAAYLYMLKHGNEEIHNEIVETVRLAIPFFDDFVLEPEALNANSIILKWRHKGFDYDFLPSQLSDGSLRFICLVTALMQPDPPSTIIIDEPELGLHPYAITLLGSLLESASERMQVIVATQSPQLLDECSVDDLIVVELEGGVSKFKRLKESDFNVWLEDYSVGELWDKNVLGGGLP